MGSVYAQIYRDSKAVDDAKRVMLDDIRQKKELARSARCRKGKKGGKKCDLMSDNLTREEWEEKNGEVKVSNIYTPMTYTEYKKKSDEYRARWIAYLRENFKASTTMIASILDDGTRTRRSDNMENIFKSEVRRLRMNGFDNIIDMHGEGHSPYGHPTFDRIERWNQWLKDNNWETGQIDIDKERNIRSKRNMQPHDAKDIVDEAKYRAENMLPMTWSMFRTLDLDVAVEYINKIRNTYNMGTRHMTEMFGCSSINQVQQWMRNRRPNGFTFTSISTHPKNSEIINKWNQWLKDNNWETGYIPVDETIEETNTAQPSDSLDAVEADEDPITYLDNVIEPVDFVSLRVQSNETISNYINKLRLIFNVDNKHLADMLKCNTATIIGLIQSLMESGYFITTAASATPENMGAWNKWLYDHYWNSGFYDDINEDEESRESEGSKMANQEVTNTSPCLDSITCSKSISTGATEEEVRDLMEWIKAGTTFLRGSGKNIRVTVSLES